ncbi:MAG: hypothetical protein ACXWQO_10740 [Bdellovibrionota bacterium]
MKLLLALFLAPIVAFANPQDHIGDYVKYEYSWPNPYHIVSRKMTILAYDTEKKSFQVEESYTTGEGSPVTVNYWISENDIFTPERGQAEVAQCQKKLGTPEKFVIDGISYDVCKRYFTEDASYELIGPFPVFGRAKLEILNDTPATEALVEFHWAKST